MPIGASAGTADGVFVIHPNERAPVFEFRWEQKRLRFKPCGPPCSKPLLTNGALFCNLNVKGRESLSSGDVYSTANCADRKGSALAPGVSMSGSTPDTVNH